jgi:hypothetical protein
MERERDQDKGECGMEGECGREEGRVWEGERERV